MNLTSQHTANPKSRRLFAENFEFNSYKAIRPTKSR
jgi:hypothetical protein